MIIDEHSFIGCEIELRIVLSEFSVADGGIFIDNTSNLHYGSCSHLLWVTLEFNDLDICIYKIIKNERKPSNKYLPSLVFIYRQLSSTFSTLPTKAMVLPTNAGIQSFDTNGWGSLCTCFTSSPDDTVAMMFDRLILYLSVCNFIKVCFPYNLKL